MKPWVKTYGALLLSGLALASLAYFIVSGRFLGQSDSAALVGFEELKDAVNSALDRKEAFQRSVVRNGDRFICLRSGGENCRGKGGQFVLYSSARDGRAISQLSDEKGLDRNKQSCSGFPGPACPYRVETTWSLATEGLQCEATRPLRVVARVVVNSGTLYHEWKRDVVVHPRIQLDAKAQCACQGKDFSRGECHGPNGPIDLAEKPAAEPKEAEVDPREAPQVREPASTKPVDPAVAAECPSQIDFRGEQFAVMNFDALGQAEIELPGEDTRCEASDVYRFQCVGHQGQGGEVGSEWVLTGVKRGECSGVAPLTTNTNDLVNAPPASNGDNGAAATEEQRIERGPMAEGLDEIRAGQENQ